MKKQNKIYLALYKGHGGDLWDKVTDAVIRLFTWSRYSHCEIAVEMDDGKFLCYSSSPRDNGVRNKIMPLPSEKWDLIDISSLITAKQVREYFVKTWHARYDVQGALGVALKIKEDKSKFFCSEWCYNVIFNRDDGFQYSPKDLGEAVKARLRMVERYKVKV